MFVKSIQNILKPKLITFDVTGTLLETKLEHYLEVGVQNGVTVANPQLLVPSFKQHFKNLSYDHPVFGKWTGIGWESWWKNIVFNVFRDQDPKIPEKILEKIATRLIHDYGTNKCWFKYPGVIDTLRYLNSKHIIVGIISNFDERLQPLLVSTGIQQYVDFILTSYDHGQEKPHISIFETALNLAASKNGSEILPEEALHIGDNLELDYKGARNAGWNALIIKHGSNSNEKLKNDYDITTFKNHEDLKNYLQNILK